MPEKVKGTVKWFSNRKGFGFITPTSDNAPSTEDIFVHQSSIVTDADYRTLVSIVTKYEDSIWVEEDGAYRSMGGGGGGSCWRMGSFMR